MNRFHSIFYCLLLITCVSCTSRKTKAEKTTKVNSETIELLAQQWPGQDPKSFNMPVYSGLDKLEFANREEVALNDADLVMGLTLEDTQIALPLLYLEGFEVANLTLNDENYLLTWCGLVGSAQLFEGTILEDSQGFDFGRALINNNLLMVDRKTKSVWNQLSNKSIHGGLKETKLNLLPSLQTTWGFWKSKHPNTKILINKDTTGAAFPSLVFARPFYTSWKPEEGNFHMEQNHQTKNLGMGIEIGESSVFFPLEELFKRESPMEYEVVDETITIHFNKSGLTAWTTDDTGTILPSILAYEWAWKNFHPKTSTFKSSTEDM